MKFFLFPSFADNLISDKLERFISKFRLTLILNPAQKWSLSFSGASSNSPLWGPHNISTLKDNIYIYIYIYILDLFPSFKCLGTCRHWFQCGFINQFVWVYVIELRKSFHEELISQGPVSADSSCPLWRSWTPEELIQSCNQLPIICSCSQSGGGMCEAAPFIFVFLIIESRIDIE